MRLCQIRLFIAGRALTGPHLLAISSFHTTIPRRLPACRVLELANAVPLADLVIFHNDGRAKAGARARGLQRRRQKLQSRDGVGSRNGCGVVPHHYVISEHCSGFFFIFNVQICAFWYILQAEGRHIIIQLMTGVGYVGAAIP